MCGIVGIIGAKNDGNDYLAATVGAMAAAISHRGPDDVGVWTDAEGGVALAHRRLAILDLSPAGHQPMLSVCGRYVIVFNGEIYNHLELRRALDDANSIWRGRSDTESLLVAVSRWGVDTALKRSVGMFALALWDRRERCLVLARDRMGEKPLYYGWAGNAFLFASELKALRAFRGFDAAIDRDALALQLRYSYIPAPHTIYRDGRKLEPGTVLRVSLDTPRLGCQRRSYWSLREVAERGQVEPFAGDDADAAEHLDGLLTSAIGNQMVADVPLGAFLSGGIDSSTVVALMQKQSSQPVRTFTIGFHEKEFNEANHARAVAAHLGTSHEELYVTPRDALSVIPLLPKIYDEPFSDPSQIPTYLVAQLTRRHVTVSLSGDAGDELLGGYNRYLLARKIWQRLHPLPVPLRSAVARMMTALPPSAWNRIFAAFGPLLPKTMRQAHAGDKMHKLAEVVSARTPDDIYHRLVSHWKDPSAVVIGSREPQTLFVDPGACPDLNAFEHRMMAIDSLTYLPDDILVKVDRAAMAVSLETRVPLLDHRVVEFVWSLPLSMKLRESEGKWLLRQVLYRYVPQAMVDRQKTGFGVPIDAWLRGPLRPWAEDLLSEARLRREGYLNPEPIRAKWRDHLSGVGNWQYYLWDVLMFQAWLAACA